MAGRWSSSRTPTAIARPSWCSATDRSLLDKAGIPPELPDGSADPGLVFDAKGGKGLADAVVAAIARHRHFERETDPPRV